MSLVITGEESPPLPSTLVHVSHVPPNQYHDISNLYQVSTEYAGLAILDPGVLVGTEQDPPRAFRDSNSFKIELVFNIFIDQNYKDIYYLKLY